ncbi:teichoic acid transport system ATP-binding protein [Luteimicrobium subarcticum]|uniref:Teichoic acid transport system ATP-binding protein n=2 Tax=Luteimicrobium subarcticum TaxID=620910 RepID=A0A2M8WTS2_9MICO|nr:teichoic acid transport system ATP-binding protein [Luteimicrobium subarcticum]
MDARFDDLEDGYEETHYTPASIGSPSLIADDVHVRYRVFGGRRITQTDQGLLRKALNRGRRHVGAVSEVHAVKGVSFVAHHGESIGILGRNGAGKSTLLRALAGLLPMAAGNVYSAGTMSLLGVNAALMGSMTGERNIMIGGLALGLTPKEVREKMPSIVEFAGIGDFVNLPMSAYSSGMAARLRFAISTSVVPDILMIDEALATGDAEFRARSQARVEEIRDEAGTVFLVSHSIASVERMCNRAIWLEQGRMVMDGPVDDVCAAYKEATRVRPKKK